MIEYATVSEIGEKEHNEDAVRVFMNPGLKTYAFVVADGLGGHGNGDIASNYVADCVGAVVENTSNISGVFLDDCFITAQEMLMEEKEIRGLESIRTTMVMLVITDNIAQWGHVGDSRLYHFRDGKLLSHTLDHSVPQLLVLSGQIKEREIRHHPDRNMLLRAMGVEWDMPAYEIAQRNFRVIKGDSFLLCSDGFWEWIDEKNVGKILKKNLPAYDALREMTKMVKINGMGNNMDNFSAALVMIK